VSAGRRRVPRGWWKAALAVATVLWSGGDLTARPPEVPERGSFRGLFAEAVTAVAPTPDGGVIIGGRDVPGTLAVVRLDRHGALDRAFSERVLGAGVAGPVDVMVPDGSGFLVGGTFDEIRPPHRRVGALRIGADGTVDARYLDAVWRGASRGTIDRVRPPVVEWPTIWTAEEIAYPEEWPIWFTGSSGWLVYQPSFSDVLGLHAAGLVGLTFPDRGCIRWLGGRGGIALTDRVGRVTHTEAGDRSLQVEAAHARADGSWIVRGTRGRGEERLVLWRVGPPASTFEPLHAVDLDPSQVLASAVLADGSVVLGGTFEAVRARPRAHIVRLSPDGSLEP
jgi:hypothetical protein